MSKFNYSDGFDYPIGKPDGKGYYNAQKFLSVGYKNTPHLGEDWNGTGGGNTDLGDPVFAISIGKVYYNATASGWGRVVIIRHELPDKTEVESMYAHLDSVSVSKNDIVSRGQQIGTIGTGGGLYISHLHFEMRNNNCHYYGSPGPGYSNNSDGWLHPTQFIEKNRKISLFAANYSSQSNYPQLIAGGEPEEWWIKFKNTGSATWENHNNNNCIVKLALGTYAKPDIQFGREFKSGWESPTRLAILEEKLVSPGQTGTFRCKVQAPSSMKEGVYRLQVTPKSPAGWLKQDDNRELNCYADITVKKDICDNNIKNLFSASPPGNITRLCSTCSDQTETEYINSKGLQDFAQPNGDILNASWNQKRCYHGDEVQMIIKCHAGVTDGSIIHVKIFEADINDNDDIVKKNITGIVHGLECTISYTVNWLDLYEPEGSSYEFYFTALIENGDKDPAKSKLLYVDLPMFTFI